MLQSVNNVQVDLVKATKDKLRVSNAAPVNLMTLLALMHANHVSSRRILAGKEETVVVLIAQPVGPLKMVVPNVSLAVLARLVLVAPIAHWDLPEKEMTLMRRNADNVNWVKQRRWKAWPRAVGVI